MRESISFVEEGRRLDSEGAEGTSSLLSVMDLVVNDVQDQVVQHVGALIEGGQRLLEPLRRNLQPERVELLRTLVLEAWRRSLSTK